MHENGKCLQNVAEQLKSKKSGGGVAIVIWIIIDIFAPQNNHLYRIIPNVIFSYGENVPYLLSEKWSNIIMTERF